MTYNPNRRVKGKFATDLSIGTLKTVENTLWKQVSYAL